MAFELDRNESAVDLKVRLAFAKTEDLIPAAALMRKKVYFAAQLPFLLEELERRGHAGHAVAEPETKRDHTLARAFLLISAAAVLVFIFFDGHLWLRDMILKNLADLHLLELPPSATD